MDKKSRNVFDHLHSRERGNRHPPLVTASQLQEPPPPPVLPVQPPPPPPQNTSRHTSRGSKRSFGLELDDTVTSKAFLGGMALPDTLTSRAAALHGGGVEQDDINHNMTM